MRSINELPAAQIKGKLNPVAIGVEILFLISFYKSNAKNFALRIYKKCSDNFSLTFPNVTDVDISKIREY